jgi:hypothetical protein
MTLAPETLLLHLRVAGVLLALLVVVHAFVPGRLRWGEELPRLSLVNRQIFEVHTFFIVLVLALSSTLLLTSSDALLAPSRLSRALLLGLTIFWGLRMLMQWFYYSPALWRGNRFNTVAHCVFSSVWVYMTATFAAALWTNLSHAAGPLARFAAP